MPLVLLLLPALALAQSYRPNIVVIMADDLGWNDVGFHGSDEIPTPNIDALAYNGIILNSYYSQNSGTAARAAFMTGRYPLHMGLQGPGLGAREAGGVPPEYKLLPGWLQELGYSTHCVGKWHLGHATPSQLPTARGCGTFFGFYTSYVGYYDYIHQDIGEEGVVSGLDLHNGTEAGWELVGKYSSDLLGDEAVRLVKTHDQSKPLFLYFAPGAVHAAHPGARLQAPQASVRPFHRILDPNRRIYAAMVSKLDEAVGRLVEALKETGLLETSIVLFLSDNGAPANSNHTQYNWGSNYPYRGGKDTLWEGGVKTVGVMWSQQFQHSPRVSQQLLHVTDWLPTLYTAAGGSQISLPGDLDGKDQWYSLTWSFSSKRNQVMLNINEKDKTAAIVAVYQTGFNRGVKWKLLVGRSGKGMYDSAAMERPASPEYDMDTVSNSTTYKMLSTLYPPTSNQVQMGLLRSEATVSKCLGTPVAPDCQRSPCLFQLEADPCEAEDLSQREPRVLSQLYAALKEYKSGLVAQPPRTSLPNALPINSTWTPWSL